MNVGRRGPIGRLCAFAADVVESARIIAAGVVEVAADTIGVGIVADPPVEIPPAPRQGDAARAAELLRRAGLLSVLPPARVYRVKIAPDLEPGTRVDRAFHWSPGGAALADPIRGQPFRRSDEACPPGITRVEIECEKRPSGGMGSWHGFEGYFVFALVDLESGTVWDARGEEAF